MRKRVYVILLSLVLLICSVCPAMGAEPVTEEGKNVPILQSNGTCGGNLTWTYLGGELEITGTGAMNNYSLTDHAPWYQYSSNSPTKVTMDEGITRIGSYAFYSHRFSSIDIPESVEYVREAAFYGCKNLASITLSNNIAEIGDRVCYDCTSLTSAVIGGKISVIPKWAFYGCTNLEEIHLPESIETIDYEAFEECYELSDIYYMGTEDSWGDIDISEYSGLSDSVTIHYLGKDTDDNPDDNPDDERELLHGTCGENLKWKITKNSLNEQKLYISGTGKMTNYSYSGDTKAPWHDYLIHQVIIEDGVESIGEYAFWNENKLVSVSMCSSVKSIGQRAFDDCTALNDIVLSKKLETIGDYAFSGCIGLTTFTLPGSVKNIGSGILHDCNNLKTLKISKGIYTIPSFAFSNRTALETLYLPGSLTEIGLNAFDGCTALQTIYYGGTEDDWDEIEIKSGNDPLDDANIVFSYHDPEEENQEEEEGNIKKDYKGTVAECVKALVDYVVSKNGINDTDSMVGRTSVHFDADNKKLIFSSNGQNSSILNDYTYMLTYDTANYTALFSCTRNGKTYTANVDFNTFPASLGWGTDGQLEETYAKYALKAWDTLIAESGYNLGHIGFWKYELDENNIDVGHDSPGWWPEEPKPELTVSDNKPMDPVMAKRGIYEISYNSAIPFWGKSKPTAASFGKITVSTNGIIYEANKIKVNKKKLVIQITGLSGADKGTVKTIKKLTKGSGGLPFKVNPYYVSDKDSVNIKRKKDGSIKSVKININGKPYKAKKGEWRQVSANKIEFTGNLAGSYGN